MRLLQYKWQACSLPAFMFVVELFSIAFGPTAATTACTITATEVAAAATVVVAGTVVAKKGYQMYSENHDEAILQELHDEQQELINNGVPSTKTPAKPKQKEYKPLKKPNNTKGGPPRHSHTSDYIPEPAAEGSQQLLFL